MNLTEKVNEFYKLLDKHASFGACDTEPRSNFRHALRMKIEKDADVIPQDADEWELYSSMEGAEEVAKELTEKLTEIINMIPKAAYQEVKKIKDEVDY